MTAFDPNAAATESSGIYGLPHGEDDAHVVLIPVPWDATTSYRPGTARGPAAILEASRQVDLFDRETGKPYERGIHLLPIDLEVEAWNAAARAEAVPVIEAGGAGDDPALARRLVAVNAAGDRLNEWVYARTKRLLDAGKLVGVVGGDHSTPFGAIRAIAERHPGVGILHVDAHADLRDAYEGFTWSHASIMRNVHERIPEVARIVQVGIRDFCEEEFEFSERSARLQTFFDADFGRKMLEGATFAELARDVVGLLPNKVYVSFDIDGLDPTSCPHTGTPVPGGLSFAQAGYLLRALVESNRRIVGFDLNEVAPAPVRDGDGPPDDWDANVGARLLYKLIGWALRSDR